MLIINLSIDGANGENSVWGWGRVNAVWLGVLQKPGKCRGILHRLKIGLRSDLLCFEWHSQICSLRFMCKLWWLDSGREWCGVGGEIKGVEKVCHQQPARPSSGKESTVDYIASYYEKTHLWSTRVHSLEQTQSYCSLELRTLETFAVSKAKHPLLLDPSPPIDNIWVKVIVWRLRGNIIRTALFGSISALCHTIQHSSVLDCVTQCSQSVAHLCEQFLQVQQIGFVTLGPLRCA